MLMLCYVSRLVEGFEIIIDMLYLSYLRMVMVW